MGRHVLAIETSNPASREDGHGPGVAIGVRGSDGAPELVGEEPVDAGSPQRDDLLPAIARLVARLALSPRDLAVVACSIGPGGFTSIRVAVSAAKMIAEATGAACVPVPTPMVAQATRDPSDFPLAVALASKGETAHVTVFDHPGRARGPGSVMTAAGLSGLGARLLLADRFLPESMRAVARDAGIALGPLRLSGAACLVASSWCAPVDPAALVPLYPREPEAVTLWRARKGG